MATFKERIDRHDREIAAIRKLLQTGMKMLVRNEEEIRKLTADLRETARLLKETDRQQKETDRRLERFIRSLSSPLRL